MVTILSLRAPVKGHDVTFLRAPQQCMMLPTIYFSHIGIAYNHSIEKNTLHHGMLWLAFLILKAIHVAFGELVPLPRLGWYLVQYSVFVK